MNYSPQAETSSFFVLLSLAAVRNSRPPSLPPSWQIFCVFLFLAGACVFGTIISNTNTVLTELGREAAELAERMEGYQALINSCRSRSRHGPATVPSRSRRRRGPVVRLPRAAAAGSPRAPAQRPARGTRARAGVLTGRHNRTMTGMLGPRLGRTVTGP